MMPKVAVVTLSIGPKRQEYDQYFLHTIKAYSKKFGFEYIEINETFDKNPAIATHKPALCLQRLLICSQPWSSQYDYIIMFDSDIFINLARAPNIIEGIPLGKIGAVCERKMFNFDFSNIVWTRWHQGRKPLNGFEYYKSLGFPDGFEHQLNAGVMVYQPKYHANFLQTLYNEHINKILNPNYVNDYDQGILSYYILKNDLVFWLDERWNMLWPLYRILFYPLIDRSTHTEIVRQCLHNIIDLSYATHMAGSVDWDLL
jgi:hypothetical protein